jgi:hypothetical protein
LDGSVIINLFILSIENTKRIQRVLSDFVFLSETTGPIGINLGMNVHWMGFLPSEINIHGTFPIWFYMLIFNPLKKDL